MALPSKKKSKHLQVLKKKRTITSVKYTDLIKCIVNNLKYVYTIRVNE